MTMKRAAKGGEVGANGEFYEGGKFINTVAANAKKEGSAPKRKARKVEVEPYKWVECIEGMRPIFTKLAGIHGRVINGVMVLDMNPVTLAYCGDNAEDMISLAAKYNAGERWM